MTKQLVRMEKVTSATRLPGPTKNRRAPRRAKSGDMVLRPRLMRMATECLTRDGIVALCSERGMGRHVLASSLATKHRALNGIVDTVRLGSGSPENSCRRIRTCVNNAIRATDDGELVLIVAEGFSEMEDAFQARMARSFEAAVENNCLVLLIVNPEAEGMLDHLEACRVLRAKELMLDEEEYVAWGNLAAGYTPDVVTRATHGIPALVATLKDTAPNLGGMPTGLTWDRAVDSLMRDALRPTLIEEEQRMRCAMAALGTGDIGELRTLGIRASRDMLEDTALVAPIFGANAKAGSFGVVPCDTNMLVRAISTSYVGGDTLLRASIHALVGRGDIVRAASLAAAMEDQAELIALINAHPLELVDAGYINLITQTMAAHEEKLNTAQLNELLSLIGVVSPLQEVESTGLSTQATVLTELDVQLGLLRLIHRLLIGGSGALEHLKPELDELCIKAYRGENRITNVIAHAAQTLSLLFGNLFSEAFRELMLARALCHQPSEHTSLFSAVLYLLFASLRALMGDPETSRDERDRYEVKHITQTTPTFGLCRTALAWHEIARVIRGYKQPQYDLSRVLSFHAHRQERAALAVVNVIAAFFSVANASYRQAYIYAGEAYRCACATSLVDVEALASMAEHMALSALGEQQAIEKLSDGTILIDKEGLSPDIAALMGIYIATTSEGIPKDKQGNKMALMATLRMRLQNARPQVIELAKFIAGCDLVYGRDFSRELPPAWREQRRKDTPDLGPGELVQRAIIYQEETGCVPTGLPTPVSVKPILQLDTPLDLPAREQAVLMDSPMGYVAPSHPILEVFAMSSLRVNLNGQMMSEARWRRNHARMLMAYLALKPNHTATRGEIIEQLWPDADYERGRESLYTTLSVLRSAIGQKQKGLQFVVSEVGRIWLDSALVSCDVDMVELLARSILTKDAKDDEIVSSCLRLEQLYGCGSYMPTQDLRGFFKRRHKELAVRFAEAMLCGANAAVRLGDQAQAKWFGSLSVTLRAQTH